MSSYASRLPFLVRIREGAARDRSRLFRDFIAALPRPVRVLDLGGTAEMWSRWQVRESDALQITLLNHHRLDTTQRDVPVTQPFIRSCHGDALALTARELHSFDVIFSNSMLEHLPSRVQQVQLADCIMASGLPFFIQVPNRRSPVDPHFPHPLVPFFALYPRELQARLLAWSHLGSGGRATSLAQARATFAHYHPLSRTDMHRLFPAATVRMQWTFGLPMSVIASWMPAAPARYVV